MGLNSTKIETITLLKDSEIVAVGKVVGERLADYTIETANGEKFSVWDVTAENGGFCSASFRRIN